MAKLTVQKVTGILKGAGFPARSGGTKKETDSLGTYITAQDGYKATQLKNEVGIDCAGLYMRQAEIEKALIDAGLKIERMWSDTSGIIRVRA